ncbi:MAG TPA: hypothetical protein VG456_22385 [Candidatus Sulfopaludibacter sp.]|nr:hypothetical protein [Candidatus Sulfopaludibacter sp.]
MDLNLDTLKHEILDYLGSTGFAIFHGAAGGLDGLPMVLWDTERYPDYRMFLDVAQKAGVKLILFASRELEADEIDEVAAQLEACELSREEYREYESRLSGLRAYEGVTCTLELAFDYNSRLHVYEVQPDWFEDFLGIEDELMTRMADDDMGEDDSLGGYYSKN